MKKSINTKAIAILLTIFVVLTTGAIYGVNTELLKGELKNSKGFKTNTITPQQNINSTQPNLRASQDRSHSLENQNISESSSRSSNTENLCESETWSKTVHFIANKIQEDQYLDTIKNNIYAAANGNCDIKMSISNFVMNDQDQPELSTTNETFYCSSYKMDQDSMNFFECRSHNSDNHENIRLLDKRGTLMIGQGVRGTLELAANHKISFSRRSKNSYDQIVDQEVDQEYLVQIYTK